MMSVATELPTIDYTRELWVRMTDRQFDPTPNELRVTRFTFGQIKWAYRFMRREGISPATARRLVMSVVWASGMEGIVFKTDNYTDDMLIYFKPSQDPSHINTFKELPTS